MLRTSLRAAVLFLFAAAIFAADAPPVLRMPGAGDRPIAPESLLAKNVRDVRLEDTNGNVTVYHGLPLLEVLENAGLELKTMAGERKAVTSVVVATARDGYMVVFSVGELHASRANPKVFLVSETALEPLPAREGPVRLVVYGDPVRSAYGLATIELRSLAPKRP